MFHIYVYTNKITGRQYVGQTNNLRLRFNGHKSDSYNTKSHSYNYPLHNAIRKHGIENFTFETLEEVETREEANEREIYWIDKLNSHVSKGGYNISLGGNQSDSIPLTWEELLEKGRLFTPEEILDIQNRLVKGEVFNDIMAVYEPRLTRSFLSNLNQGYNFKNPNLIYPLKTDFSYEHTSFSKEQILQIKQDIKNGIPYSKIQQEYGIKSAGFVSGINSGRYFFDKNETYPLCLKGCADKRWVKPCIEDILFTSLSLKKIGEKYGKKECTIQKFHAGGANRQEGLKYPLRKYREENQQIFNVMFK